MGLTDEAALQLHDGINLVLSRWAALRMAIEYKWGGRDSAQKSQLLSDNLFNRLTQSREQVYIEDLEDILDEFMDSLNTVIEDGSIEEVSLKLMEMHEKCLEGNFDSIRELRETNAPTIIRQPTGDDEEDSEADDDDNALINSSEEMEVDPPQCPANPSQKSKAVVSEETSMKEVPEVEDGWTTVSSRRSRGRRN